MNSKLPFDFLVDRGNNSFHIRRDFAADLGPVWQAWTTPELLDQWWAPKPYPYGHNHQLSDNPCFLNVKCKM